MRSARIASVAGLFIIAACQPPPPPVDLEAARAALQAADRQYSEVIAAKNIDAFVGFYAAEASMYPPAEPTATGLEAIRAVGTSFLQDPAFAVTFQPVSAEVSKDGTLGYTLNTADITVTGPDGKPMSERIRDFHVWRRQGDGSWKVIVDLWNAEPPATPAGTQ